MSVTESWRTVKNIIVSIHLKFPKKWFSHGVLRGWRTCTIGWNSFSALWEPLDFFLCLWYLLLELQYLHNGVQIFIIRGVIANLLKFNAQSSMSYNILSRAKWALGRPNNSSHLKQQGTDTCEGEHLVPFADSCGGSAVLFFFFSLFIKFVHVLLDHHGGMAFFEPRAHARSYPMGHLVLLLKWQWLN